MRDFLEQNEIVLAFAHGLMFFALGFAIWLQRRRTTRLRLTSSLIWLGAFAFIEAFAVWGYVFVPIQTQTVDPAMVDALMILRALVQTAAFLFLWQFGMRLLNLSGRAVRIGTVISIASWAAILLGGWILARPAGWDIAEWEHSVEAAARYWLLLPAALVSAAGLWRQRDELAASGVGWIRHSAAATAIALAAYAVFAGLIVEPAPWAPGGIANQQGWLDATGLPLAAVRGLIGLALLILVVRLLEIFEVEAHQQIQALERARLVAEERARFSRDLHDGTIQSIYGAGLQLEAAALDIREPVARRQLRGAIRSLNEVIDGIRDYIRGLAEPPAGAEGVTLGLRELTNRHIADTGRPVRFEAYGVTAAGPLPAEAGHHLGQILREALSNSARHAGACGSHVVLRFGEDELELEVCDDGCGINPVAAPTGGHGLRNMRERAHRLGGRLAIRSEQGRGTTVTVAVPLDSDLPDEPAGGVRSTAQEEPKVSRL